MRRISILLLAFVTPFLLLASPAAFANHIDLEFALGCPGPGFGAIIGPDAQLHPTNPAGGDGGAHPDFAVALGIPDLAEPNAHGHAVSGTASGPSCSP